MALFPSHIFSERRSPSELVADLLEWEKEARYQPPNNDLRELQGEWRLHFVTGTQKVQQQAGSVVKQGLYLPRLVKIILRYELTGENRGRMVNTVNIGPLRLTVSGPCRWQPPRNILAFDFTHLRLQLGPLSLFNNYLGNGAEREQNFEQTAIAKQPFFVFFVVDPRGLAARGRGGGLAVWVRELQTS